MANSYAHFMRNRLSSAYEIMAGGTFNKNQAINKNLTNPLEEVYCCRRLSYRTRRLRFSQ